MKDLLFGPVSVWFSVPALVGTFFFAVRTLLMLLGGLHFGGGDVDLHADAPDLHPDVGLHGGADAHGTGADSDSSDSSEAFKILSLQTIAAFAMGFGWGGLGAYAGGGWPLVVSAAFAIACGAGMVWLLAKLLTMLYRLQSSGNIPLYHALATEGTVYTSIPAKGMGSGQVRLVVDDRERFYKAISDGEALPTREKVRVVDINDDNSVTVTKA